MKKAKVFICHSSADKEFVRKLCRELGKFGIKTWLDEREIKVGDSIVELIEGAILNSDYVLAVLSPNSIKSGWVKKEISGALHLEIKKNKKFIIPVLIKKCKLPVFLMDKKYADFRDSFKIGLTQLLDIWNFTKRSSFNKDFVAKSSTTILDIKNKMGSRVLYTKENLLKCLQDNVEYYSEMFYVDGFMEKFEVTPGKISKVWKESGMTYVVTKFPKPINRHENISRIFKVTFVNAFMQDCEYWEGRQVEPGDLYALKIKFPLSRSPKSWETYERDGSDTFPTKWKAKRTIENGRTVLELRIKNPELYNHYILRWWW